MIVGVGHEMRKYSSTTKLSSLKSFWFHCVLTLVPVVRYLLDKEPKQLFFVSHFKTQRIVQVWCMSCFEHVYPFGSTFCEFFFVSFKDKTGGKWKGKHHMGKTVVKWSVKGGETDLGYNSPLMSKGVYKDKSSLCYSLWSEQLCTELMRWFLEDRKKHGGWSKRPDLIGARPLNQLKAIRWHLITHWGTI